MKVSFFVLLCTLLFSCKVNGQIIELSSSKKRFRVVSDTTKAHYIQFVNVGTFGRNIEHLFIRNEPALADFKVFRKKKEFAAIVLIGGYFILSPIVAGAIVQEPEDPNFLNSLGYLFEFTGVVTVVALSSLLASIAISIGAKSYLSRAVNTHNSSSVLGQLKNKPDLGIDLSIRSNIPNIGITYHF